MERARALGGGSRFRIFINACIYAVFVFVLSDWLCDVLRRRRAFGFGAAGMRECATKLDAYIYTYAVLVVLVYGLSGMRT